MYIAGEAVVGDAGAFHAVDPADGSALEPGFQFADGKLVARAAELAESAFEPFRAAPVEQRARLLELAADEIDAVGAEAAERAHRETGLPLPRLTGEVGRTTGQLRLFAAALREGSWNGARIDHALPDRKPARRPDVRSRRVPIGPVAVFAASNFPLAFSVAGGDTASALAAGCPVVVKAHDAHPGTSEIVAAAVTRAVAASGLPAGVFSMVYADGPTVGVELVTHPAIAAVAFTGSRRVGLALVAAAASRPVPIPVFAEMSAVNPVFLLPGRLSEAAAELGAAYVGSLTLGAGQFCTNPGIVIGIDGPDLDRFTGAARDAVAASPAAPMLTGRIAEAYADGATRLADHPGTEVIALGADPGRENGRAGWGCAALVATTADEFLAARELHDEVFGATSVIVRAADPSQLHRGRAGDGGAAHRDRARHRRGRAAGGGLAPGARAAGGADPVQRLADRGRGRAVDGARRPVPRHLRRPHDVGRHAGDGPVPAAGGLPGRARLPAAGRGPRVQPGRAAPPGRRRVRPGLARWPREASASPAWRSPRSRSPTRRC